MNLTRKQFIGALIAPFVVATVPILPKPLVEYYPNLDALNLITLKEFGNFSLEDNFFQTSSILARLREGTPLYWTADGKLSSSFKYLKPPYDYEVVNIHPPPARPRSNGSSDPGGLRRFC